MQGLWQTISRFCSAFARARASIQVRVPQRLHACHNSQLADFHEAYHQQALLVCCNVAAQQWQQEGQQQKKYAEIRRRVQPGHSRPATSLGMSRAACMAAKPEQIYQVKPRPATAVVSTRLQPQYGSVEVLREVPQPISALTAGRPVTAA